GCGQRASRPEGSAHDGGAGPRAGVVARGGGRGRRSDRADLLEVGWPLPGRRGAGAVGSLFGAAAGAQSHRGAHHPGDRRAQAGAGPRPGDRAGARSAVVDGVGDPDADRDGPARPSGPAARGGLRKPAAGGAGPTAPQDPGGPPGRARGAPASAGAAGCASTKTRPSPTATGIDATPWAGTTCTSPSTTPP